MSAGAKSPSDDGSSRRPADGTFESRLLTSIGWRREFTAAALLAVGVHAIVFLPVRASPPDTSTTAVSVMQVRVLPVSAAGDAGKNSPARSLVQSAAPPITFRGDSDTVTPATDAIEEQRKPTKDFAALVKPATPKPLPAVVAPGASVPIDPAGTSITAFPARPAPALAAIASLPPALDYLPSVRLDPGPRPLDNIEPDYPPEGQLQQGKVALRLLISETGHVDNVAVVSSYPPGLFDRAALAAFENARFAPALMLGTPTKSQITIEVNFEPFNRGSRVSGRGY